MASARKLEAEGRLVEIEGARAAGEKSRLMEAEGRRRTCETELAASEARTAEAYEAWSASIGSKALGPSYLLAAGERLLAAESQLVGARKSLEAAEREAEEQAGRFRSAEARRSGSEKRYRKQRRLHLERRAERRQDEVQELLLARRARP